MGCREESSILQSWNISTTLPRLEYFPWVEVLGISGTKVCGFFCGSATATAATERLSEALWINNVKVLLWKIKPRKTRMSSMSARVQLAVEGF